MSPRATKYSSCTALVQQKHYLHAPRRRDVLRENLVTEVPRSLQRYRRGKLTQLLQQECALQHQAEEVQKPDEGRTKA